MLRSINKVVKVKIISWKQMSEWWKYKKFRRKARQAITMRRRRAISWFSIKNNKNNKSITIILRNISGIFILYYNPKKQKNSNSKTTTMEVPTIKIKNKTQHQ